jgi:phosphatidylinositol glycan class B
LRKFYIVAFLLFIFTAFMSEGFFHEDEHFQLIEFANFKMGNIPADDLPWEYAEQMRPTFQVAITYVIFSGLKSIGITDPFTTTTILRILTAILSFIALYFFFNKYKIELKDKSSVNWFAGLTFFLWYVPFISVRFSSESFGTIFMLLGICFYHVPGSRSKLWKYLMVGVFLGLSFICRYQMGFMIFGMGLWLLIVRKENIKIIGIILAGFLISIIIGLCSDYWFYGKWVLSAYNYFYQNLVENKAAGYGISPIWFYAVRTPLFVFPLFGLIIVPCLIAFFIKYPKHIFTWLLIPFILVHHLIGHKEMRFLFPMAPFIPLIIVLVMQKTATAHYARFLKYPFWILNILFLIIMSSKPAYDNMGVFKYLYRKGENKPTYFISPQNPFRMWIPEVATQPYRPGVDLTMHYYYRKGFHPLAMKNIDMLDSSLTANQQPALFVTRTIAYQDTYGPEMTKRGIQHQVVYNTYHSYFKNLNWGDWMEAEDIGVWTIVEVKK